MRAAIEKDFDLISELPSLKWNHNNYFNSKIINEVPINANHVLEVGCGKGELCNLMHHKSKDLTGIDLSNKMIESANTNKSKNNIDFVCGDYLKTDFNSNTFDFIVSVATVHHIDFKNFILKSKKELKPGGKLLIIDLYKTPKNKDLLNSVISLFYHYLFNLIYNKRLFATKLEKQYWREHSKLDKFMSFKDINELSKALLKNAIVKKELFWRYSLLWYKPKH